jgi:hypothetical protein
VLTLDRARPPLIRKVVKAIRLPSGDQDGLSPRTRRRGRAAPLARTMKTSRCV